MSLSGLFRRGLASRGGATALSCGPRKLTFEDLEHRANTLAARLQDEFGVAAGDRVVVIARKAPEIVVAAVAIWKSSAIYAPVDGAEGPGRLAEIARSLEPILIISSAEALDAYGLRGGRFRTLAYEDFADEPCGAGVRARDAAPDCPALIIHTSGSTGRPKGVVLSHRSVITYFENHNLHLKFGPESCGLNNGPFHFDVAIQDTFLPLYFGATVVMHADVWLSSVMTALIQREGVTHLIAVSSVLQLISAGANAVESLRDSRLHTVVTGAEVCDPKLIDRWLLAVPGLRVLYGYGPTECNSLCTTYEITRPEPARTGPYPIGRPFPGHTAYLLDDTGEVIRGPGVTGVLAIAGPQLMTGYWRAEEETAKAFRVVNGEKSYLTGDRCYRDPAGDLVFAGRQDAEIKLRGRRINLNEVSHALMKHPQVSYALVHVVDLGGERRIAGLVHGSDIDLASLRIHLAKQLPPYMIPSHLVRAERLRMTSTHKADDGAMRSLLAEAIARAPEAQVLDLADSQVGATR